MLDDGSRAESELNRELEHYRRLVESMSVIPWELDLATWRFTYVAPQVVDWLGYPLDMWYEDDFWRTHLHPDDREWAVNFCVECAGRREHHEFDYRMIAVDGGTVWVRDIVTVDVGPAGPEKLRGVMMDITERKATEEALKLSEQQLSRAQEVAKLGVIDWNVRTDELFCSRQWYDLIGVDPDRFVTTIESILAFVHPEDIDEVKRRLELAVTDREEYDFDHRLVRSDGTVISVHAQGQLIKDEEGRPLRLLGTVVDITDRKAMEDRLADRERHYEGLFENVPISLWEEDFSRVKGRVAGLGIATEGELAAYLDEHPDFVSTCAEMVKVTAVNRASVNLHRAANAGQLMSSLTQTFTGQSYVAFRDELIAIWKNVTSRSFEAEVRTLDGETRQVELYWSVVPGYEDTMGRVLVAMVDVTDRKLAVAALQKSEAALRKAQEVARVGFIDWDLQTDTISWSDEVYRMLGLSPGSFQPTRETTIGLVHSDDVEHATRHFDDAANGISDYSIDHRMMCLDGSVIWVHAQGELLTGTDGNPSHLLGTIVDITDRKRAEDELRVKEEHYRSLFESVPLGLWEHDLSTVTDMLNGIALPEGMTIHEYLVQYPAFVEACAKAIKRIAYNRQVLELHAARSEAELDEALRLTLKLEARDTLRSVLEAMWRRDTSGFLPSRIVTVNGGIRHVELRWSVVAGHERTYDRVLISFTDVTERHRTEETRVRLEAVIEQAGEGIMITDARDLIQYVNPAFENITGYSCEEVLGKSPSVLNSDRHDAAFYENIKETLAAHKVWRGTFTDRRKDGSLFNSNSSISVVRGPSGDVMNYVQVMEDVTKQVELENQLRHAQRMESVGQLAAGVAHDFNNLLTPIVGYAEILLNTFAPEDDRRTDLQEIVKAGERARDLTRQLLAFGRKQVLEKRSIDLGAVVKGLEGILRRTISEAVQIDWTRPPAPLLVEADASQIEQVLINLAINAQDAMPDGGTLTIELARSELDESQRFTLDIDPAPAYARLVVSDTGQGIPQEIIERVWDPFFTTKPVGRGTGLGLSTVHGIVKQHGGAISVSSEAGRGTRFDVYLPCTTASAHPTTGPTRVRAGTPTGTEVIMVVEDNDSVRQYLDTVLRQLHYRVISKSNPLDCLSHMDTESDAIDLLLTDVVMPEMSGFELYHRLHERHPDIDVLFVSGYPREATLEGVEDFEGHFLRKPMSLGALAQKIRSILDSV